MPDNSRLAPRLISIKELNDYKFEIPVYQRGFRWTRQQIKELIDDLYDFFHRDNKATTYCLQNITVRKKASDSGEIIYEVIDGQQRLTAIWLLVMSYRSFESRPSKTPIYTLSYDEKETLTDYVTSITTQIIDKQSSKAPANVEILEITAPHDNIDASYISDAFTYIINDYSHISPEDPLYYQDVLRTIFGPDFKSGEKKIVVIWNEIKPTGDNDDEKTKYIIDRFSNLNANKIPLTESELIKAYFIEKLPTERVPEFTLQWEEMERGLNDDEFWWFLASGKDEETRMDLLFRVHLNIQEAIDSNGQHHLSREINNRLKDSESACSEWSQVVQIYDTLSDWFNDYYYYHAIGLIIAIKPSETSSIIRDLYDKYNHANKNTFKELLRQQIRTDQNYKIPFQIENGDWCIKNAADIYFEGEGSKEISYIKNKNIIQPILLLFNIALLLNAYSINPKNSAERFSFKLFKSKDNPIEIEHINPKHLEGKKRRGSVYKKDIKTESSDYTTEDKKEWAKSTIKIIEDNEKRYSLEAKINGLSSEKDLEPLIEKIELDAQINDLSNLTLVDKNLNIRYGDNFFKAKRNHILAARFGNPIPDKDDYYKQSVIFPGTMWVFMRQYIDGSDKDGDRWDATDRRKYIECMKNSIYRFLKPSTDNKNKAEKDGE